jgi:drug/metabolite transporter (DMT)-like permease
VRVSLRPHLYFVAVVLLWASTPVLVDRLYEEKVGVLVLLASASTFAAATLFLFAAVARRLHQVRSYSERDWTQIVGMGFLGIVGYTSLYYLAFRYAPPDEVNVVNYLWPVFLVIFSGPILRERHDGWTWLGVGLSFVGAAGILMDWQLRIPSAVNLCAYLLAAAGAVCWALFSVLGKRLRYDKLAAMAFYCLVGAVVFNVALVVYGAGQWPSAGAWARLVFLGAAVNGIAYVLWFEALAGGPTAVFGNLVFATPFLALIYLRVFRDTPLRPGVWLSLALIAVGSSISLNRVAAKGKPSLAKPQSRKD